LRKSKQNARGSWWHHQVWRGKSCWLMKGDFEES